MFFEIGSSVVAGGVLFFTFFQKNTAVSDAQKIQRIVANANLNVKENGRTKSIRLQRKRKIKGGMEYVYQLPLGLSVKQMEDHRHLLEDGLNVRQVISWEEIKKLKLDKTILQQIKRLFRQEKAQKEVVIDFDGMLRIRVYEQSLPKSIEWQDDMRAKKWAVPVGFNRDGLIHHDFEKRPHIVVAGTTGYGKSQYLKLLITTLIQEQPDNVHFSLVDLKGGTAFYRFKDLKQVNGVAKDPEEAKEMLTQVQEQMEERLSEVVHGGFEDVQEAGIKDRHFIIVDEAADLDKPSLEIVTDIARRGRAAGVRLVYATQYPTNETLPSQVRQNIGGRISFVLETTAASLATLDEKGAEDLPEIPGRAIYKRVKKEVVQCPYITNDQIKEQIALHINIRGRDDEHPNTTSTANREHSLIIEDA